jgi:hypothetical protein
VIIIFLPISRYFNLPHPQPRPALRWAAETIFFKQTEHCWALAEQPSHKTCKLVLVIPEHRKHFLTCGKKANLAHVTHNILLSWYIDTGGYTMEPFFPFIYSPPQQKEWEPSPLYAEIESPPLTEKPKEQEENLGVIVIELF